MNQKIFILLILIALLPSCRGGSNQIIEITGQMIINETGYGNSMSWFDEPDTSKIPGTLWETPGNKDFWPAGIVIDLGMEFQVSGILIFDGPASGFNGSDFEHSGGKIEIAGGIPFKWAPSKYYSSVNDSSWHFFPLEITSRYLHLVKHSGKTYKWRDLGPFYADVEIREIILLGKPGKKKIRPEKTDKIGGSNSWANDEQLSLGHSVVTMDSFIGINGFSWSPGSYLEQMGFVREYHHWKSNGVSSVNSPISWLSIDRKVNFDKFYMRHKNKICADIHRHVLEDSLFESRPDGGNDPENPGSYDLISDYMFQFSARYGSKIVPEKLLRNKPGEPSLSGLDLVSYLETWNEPDRWWGKEGEHFTPYQMAAMTSATYDGHLGTMGINRGGKNADPAMKMVIGGLSSLDTSYIKAMKFWSDFNRDGFFPADVINFHHYCNTSNGQKFDSGTKGISPEADDFKGQMQRLVSWRNQNLPGCEIWISEFGWDTSPDSPQAATGHSLFPESVTPSKLQAIWLVRSYLAGAAAGIDRMFMFMLNDEEGEGLFKTCGLLSKENIPKISWYYLAATRKIFEGTHFAREINSGQADVSIYQFSNDDNSRDIYVIWCPTSDGTTVENFLFAHEGSVSKAKLVKFADDMPSGVESPLRFIHNLAGVDVSETPVMVVLEK